MSELFKNVNFSSGQKSYCVFPRFRISATLFRKPKLKFFITLGKIFQSEDKKAMKDVDISVVSVTMAVRCRGGR